MSKWMLKILLPMLLLVSGSSLLAQTPPATIAAGTTVTLNSNCPSPCHLWGSISSTGIVSNSISVAVGTVAKVKTGTLVKNVNNFWYLEVVTADQKDGFAGVEWLTVSITTPPSPPPPPPPTALAGFACTPAFAPVTFSTFVPAGAQGLKVSVLNPSTVALTITAVEVATPFSVSGVVLPITVAPKGTQDFLIKFTPTATGTFTASIKFTANVAEGSFQMGVSGISQ